MLKDKLSELTNKSLSPKCKFAQICLDLDTETRGALMRAVAAPTVSSKQITKALRESGIMISSTSIKEARHCLNDTKADCHKCLSGVE